MAENLEDLVERYLKEIRKVALGVQKEANRAVKEMDRLGKTMYEDMRSSVKDPGSTVNNIRVRMMDDINREVPNMVNEVKKFGERMDQYLDELKREARRERK